MLIKLGEHFKRTPILRMPYKGEVVSNEDPKKLGRLKVNIPGLIEGNEDSLPWCAPVNPTGLGGKPDSSGFAVPEVGSYLMIKFPFEDIYSPFYVGYWQDALTHQTIFDTDYPDSYGFIDSIGNSVVVNKKQETVNIETSSGNKVSSDKDGNLNIESGKDTNFVAGDKFTVNSTGDTNIEAGGQAVFKGDGLTCIGTSSSATEIKGASVVINSSSSVDVNASVVNLAGGGVPIARLGDNAVGIGAHGVKVSSIIVSGSSKVTSG